MVKVSINADNIDELLLLNTYLESVNGLKDESILTVDVTELKNVLFYLKNDEQCLYKVLIDIFVVDYIESEKRFDVIYSLLSVKYNTRIKVKVCISEFTPVVSTVGLYSNANWLEREIWDMHGIFVDEHPDLRRILTDYGFEGYPLRKDFPLSGYTEVRYDESQKRVITEPLELTQEFRVFNFKSLWE